jgi:nucleotide-binding universal stress UspA family protein
MPRIERILCAVDFSECSRRGIDYAVAMARWYNARVTALHVVPPLLLTPYFETPSYPVALQRKPEDFEQTRQDLAQFAEQEGGGSCVTPLVVEGSTVNEIRALREDVRDGPGRHRHTWAVGISTVRSRIRCGKRAAPRLLPGPHGAPAHA